MFNIIEIYPIDFQLATCIHAAAAVALDYFMWATLFDKGFGMKAKRFV